MGQGWQISWHTRLTLGPTKKNHNNPQFHLRVVDGSTLTPTLLLSRNRDKTLFSRAIHRKEDFLASIEASNMTSRGRGRPGARPAPEPSAAPGGRRSARGQPPQQAQQQDNIDSQIDPAITGDTMGSMAPPPPPTAKKGRSQSEENAHVKDIPRRGARPPASQAASVASINSLPTSSQDLQSEWRGL